MQVGAERGYGNTTIEHISTEAGVGVATIYRRWDDKAAIANDLFCMGLDSIDVILAEPSAAGAREARAPHGSATSSPPARRQ